MSNDDVSTTFFDDVEAYCWPLSCTQGQRVGVHVATSQDAGKRCVDVLIERWGGDRSVVWQQTRVPVEAHPAPSRASAEGCDWPPAVTVDVGLEWRSGFYLVTVIGSDLRPGHDRVHACFVVRSREPTEDALLVLSTNTWNAYNPWGGSSLYTGGTHVSFRRPLARGMLSRALAGDVDRKAPPVGPTDEPDVTGRRFESYRRSQCFPSAIGSSGWFTHERRFVEWAERLGYRFDMATSADIGRALGSDLLDRYRLILSVGHDEYWSAAQRDAVEEYTRRGGNVASFSGNTMFWQVRLDDESADDPSTMVCYKYDAHLEDPVLGQGRPHLMTGMWADPIVSRPESGFLGAGSAWGLYNRFGRAVPRGTGAFTVYRDDHWLVAGTGLRYGDLLGARHGSVGYETVGCRIQFDEVQLPVRAGGDGTPEDLEIVAFTPSANLSGNEYPDSVSAPSDEGDLEFIAERLHGGISPHTLDMARHGNAVMVVSHPFGRPEAGGAPASEVVTIGTTDWVFGLAGDPGVEAVTRNVLDRYAGDRR